jgi:hypothetical protein
MQQFIDEKMLGAQLNVSLPALRRWRYEGKGPGFSKLSAAVRYSQDSLEEWLATRPRGGEAMR